MPLNTYTQKTTEVKNYTIDYSAWLDTAEDLATVVVNIDQATTPPLVVTPNLDIPNHRVVIAVSGGVDGEQYDVSVRVSTSLSQIKDDCIVYQIEDDC